MPPGASSDDQVTTGRTASRNFDDLFAGCRLELLRLALLIVDDLPTAEDVTQDAFVGLYRNWEKLRDESKAPEYLRSAVINNSRSALRRRQFARLLPSRLRPAPEVLAPDLVIAEEEDQQRVRAALRRVSPRRREALVLRYYSDLSYQEIAGTLSISVGTVKSLISRGMRNLAKELGENDG
jgi:RNA polymerase sigma-70 factor (sigma-E family)